MRPTDAQVTAGHAFYTSRTLALYDIAILGYFSRVAWRCPSRQLLAHYDEHVTGNHLDVGVGTGYFLDRCQHPVASPRIVLLDANPACLDVAQRRLDRLDPGRLEASVLDPIPFDGPPFTSIGMTYLLHCLPGRMADKAVAFDHVAALAAPGATVFGATLLSEGVHRNWYARAIMRWNNKRGIFCNEHDDLDGLRSALEDRFDDVTVTTTGCVALFNGKTRDGAPEPSDDQGRVRQ